jgi:hypothetical protein
MTKNGRYLVAFILPILAAILATTGDFLLGYVEPGAIGRYGMVQAGWSDVALWRPALSMFFAVIAFPLYLVGLHAISRQIAAVSPVTARVFIAASVLASLGWLFIHALFCIPQIAYKYLHDAGEPVLALGLTDQIYRLLTPTILVCLAMLAAALAFLFVAIISGKTMFAGWCALANPLVVAVAMVPLVLLFPDSALVYGFSLSTPNLGMLSFFIVAAVYGYKQTKEGGKHVY